MPPVTCTASLDDIDVTIGGRAGQHHTVGSENKGIGSTAQLRVQGSDENNIIIGGYQRRDQR